MKLVQRSTGRARSPEVATRFDPRLYVLDGRDGITVWRVDGRAIRNCLDIEFTTTGHVYDTAYVPDGELWLDREAVATEEWRAWAARGRHEITMLDAGASTAKAFDEGVLVEQEYRRRRHDTRRLYIDDLGLCNGLRIRLVHGCYVRDHFYLDFVHGGHPFVYGFIPPGEIWVDDILTPDEFAPTVAHEIFEMGLMARGLNYEAAHERASRREASSRHCRGDL